MFDSLLSLKQALQKRTLSCVELIDLHIKKIKAQPALNAFISLNEEAAYLQAKAADYAFQKNQAQALTGIPMAHKDNFCTKHLPTTCASKMLLNFTSPYEATLVKNLNQAGAIMLGKTNMDEFAMGSSNENSYFGSVKNPWDKTCVPGGSSGGSAAAVAADLVAFATGTDTGGSIRQPAAFCGISGLKPTYGLISRFGMVAFASSLDHAGPMARSAADLALVLQSMASFDPNDSTSVSTTIPNYSETLNAPIKNLRIGLPTCFFQNEVDADIQEAIKKAVNVFTDLGAHVIEINLPLQSLWVPCYYVIACAEASSNLSRYDGIRFGYRSHDETASLSVEKLITRSRTEAFGNEVKRRILTGTHLLSSGFYEAYYLQALKIRRLIQQELQENFQAIDVILGPTTPTCAFKIGENRKNLLRGYLSDEFTVAANLAGLPALSIPAGFKGHLPIGMQLIGPHFHEARLLNIAHQFQQATMWHKAKPPIDI